MSTEETNDFSKPIVDPSYIEELYEEVIGMEVPLDENPLDYDPSRLNSKIQKCRSHLDVVERKSQLSNRDLHTLKGRHLLEKKLYDIKERTLFSDNAEVRAPKHIEDRKRAASKKLEAELKSLSWLECGIADHTAMLEALKLKRADLKNTQSQIKEQIKLCNESLSLGMRWGTRGNTTIDLRPGVGQDHIREAIEDVEKGLGDLEGDDIELDELEDVSEEVSEVKNVNGLVHDHSEDDILEDLEHMPSDEELDAAEKESSKIPENTFEMAEEASEDTVDNAVEMSELEKELDNLVGDILTSNDSEKEESNGKSESKVEDDSEIDDILGSDAMAQAAKPAAPEAEDDDDDFDLGDILG